MKRRASSILALAALVAAIPLAARAAETVNVTVSKIKDLNVRMYGFTELDYIQDTTQPGFLEEEGNNAIPMRTTGTPKSNVPTGVTNYPGQHNRSLMSVRNSRLGFDLTVPKTDSGLDTEGIIELDFLGNQTGNNERDSLNNAAVRVRHAYANINYNTWNAKLGQTWSLLGWQPYYFPGEAIVQPGPGQLYRRFAQARVTNTQKLGNDWTFESAADAAKPAQLGSGGPEWQGGLRLASTKWKATSVGGGGGASMVGLSAAVSGALIPFRSAGYGNPVGKAVAFDAAVPILPSSDGKDRSNTLVWMGELMSGTGVGGLEFSGLSSGVTGPGAGVTGGTAYDSGMAGVNPDGNVELIRYKTFRTHLQYSLPGGKWLASVGYAQSEARNLDRFENFADPSVAYKYYPKIQFEYASLIYEPLSWLRVGGEWNQTKDTYNDPNNRYAVNNRVQLSTYFMF